MTKLKTLKFLSVSVQWRFRSVGVQKISLNVTKNIKYIFLKLLRSPLKWAILSFLLKCWTTCWQQVHFSSIQMSFKAARLDPSRSTEADENSVSLWLSCYDLYVQSPKDTEKCPVWSQLLLKSRTSPLSQQGTDSPFIFTLSVSQLFQAFTRKNFHLAFNVWNRKLIPLQ